MKKVYYVCNCGSGTSVHGNLLELVKVEGNKYTFHIDTYDWDKNERRVITLKAYLETEKFNDKTIRKFRFRSSKEQFRFSFIREVEIDDNEEPENCKIWL